MAGFDKDVSLNIANRVPNCKESGTVFVKKKSNLPSVLKISPISSKFRYSKDIYFVWVKNLSIR